MGILMRMIHNVKRMFGSNRIDFELEDIAEEKLDELAEEKANEGLRADDSFEIPDIELTPPDELAPN